MILLDVRCRSCCCKHYSEDYIALHPEYDQDEPIGDKIVRLAREGLYDEMKDNGII